MKVTLGRVNDVISILPNGGVVEEAYYDPKRDTVWITKGGGGFSDFWRQRQLASKKLNVFDVCRLDIAQWLKEQCIKMS